MAHRHFFPVGQQGIKDRRPGTVPAVHQDNQHHPFHPGMRKAPCLRADQSNRQETDTHTTPGGQVNYSLPSPKNQGGKQVTRTEKEQAIRQKVENLEGISDILLDVILSILENGGDAK